MRIFTVNEIITNTPDHIIINKIEVEKSKSYTRVVIGKKDGKHKSTWIPIGPNDINDIVSNSFLQGDVDVITTKKEMNKNGVLTSTKHLIIKPKKDYNKNNALVLWKVPSGYMRSEEHTSELQSHSFISYAVFCLKKKKDNKKKKKKRQKRLQ